jgi:hypothetical protein
MRELRQAWTRLADEWWAEDFGCTPGELRPTTTRVQAHTARLQESSGIWILVAGGAPIVSMPGDVFQTLGEHAVSWTRADVVDEAQLLRRLSSLGPGRIGKVIGPAFISYGSEPSLDLRDAARAVPLSSEQTTVETFKAAFADEDWQHGGSEADGRPLFGAFDETQRLAALAGYKIWNGTRSTLRSSPTPPAAGAASGAPPSRAQLSMRWRLVWYRNIERCKRMPHRLPSPSGWAS